MAVAVQQREAQRERRARHVAAAHVQQPGDRIRLGDQRHVGALGLDRAGDARALGGAALAGELVGMRQHRRQRRGWPVAPHGVDGIGIDRHEVAAGALAGAGEAVVAVDRHQPGIEAELAALRQVLGDPRLGRFLGDLVRHEGVGIDLGAHRQRVAAVDEDRRAIGQHDGEAGRAAEAGEPREPLRAPRHVLALMLVGARHDEAVEAALPELGAQRGQARHRRGRGAEPVIGPRQLVAPGLERPGELGVCTGIDQFDPFRAGQTLGGCGNAAHQGIEGRGVGIAATLAQQVKDVVWGGTHVGGTLRGRFRRGNLRNFRSLATAKCAIRQHYAQDAYQSFQAFTYRCNSRLYISSVQRSIDLPRCTIRSRP